jgi:guanylate kinase
VSIFVLPPSFQVLESRLRRRSKDTGEAIARRLATARAEVRAVSDYDYVVINDDVERCVEELQAIVRAERARRARRAAVIGPIVKTFLS